MARSRRPVPLTLTAHQRERLERLWFTYGNYGPKITPSNHGFKKRLLEDGLRRAPALQQPDAQVGEADQ